MASPFYSLEDTQNWLGWLGCKLLFFPSSNWNHMREESPGEQTEVNMEGHGWAAWRDQHSCQQSSLHGGRKKLDIQNYFFLFKKGSNKLNISALGVFFKISKLRKHKYGRQSKWQLIFYFIFLGKRMFLRWERSRKRNTNQGLAGVFSSPAPHCGHTMM